MKLTDAKELQIEGWFIQYKSDINNNDNNDSDDESTMVYFTKK